MHTFRQHRELNCSINQLYQLISDIEEYPNFIPWCGGITILEHQNPHIKTEVLINAFGIFEKYISNITLSPVHEGQASVLITSEDGPFKSLYSQWLIKVVSPDITSIDFSIEFDLKSRILDIIMRNKLPGACARIMSAFEQKAKEIGIVV